MKKILIVDDDQTIVDLLINALGADDRTIRRAYDGKAAQNWISKETFDLIICDLMMPKMHGFQLIEWIRSNPQCAQTRIIVLTAKSYKRDAEKARLEGADLFISKPFEITELMEKVRQLLN
ncbi:MAG: response regulator [bacterium]|nr:response regulator [bacterium]